MLEDHKRTGAYYNACMQNRAQFAGKTVLDVGTGSGILAIFAAKAGARRRAVVRWVVQLQLLLDAAARGSRRAGAGKLCSVLASAPRNTTPPALPLSPALLRPGAKKVYAVEATDMAKLAKRLVAAQGLEGVVEVIQGVIESVDIPEKVDIIISEWMVSQAD